MELSQPTCATCPYWEADEPDAPRVGECHRMPPASHLRDQVEVWWPRTGRNDWCGEHTDFPAYLEATRAAR